MYKDTYLEIDIERPDFKKYPRFVNATRYTGVVEAGDCLYLPTLWTHQVYTGKCDNIGINMWYRPTVQRPVVLLHNLVHTHLFRSDQE
jgi:hypothetical protein